MSISIKTNIEVTEDELLDAVVNNIPLIDILDRLYMSCNILIGEECYANKQAIIYKIQEMLEGGVLL